MPVKQKKTDAFSAQIKSMIRRIPRGRVATYGQIAFLAGNHCGARQVVRILHACSAKERLPWHRVINHKGMIGLRPGQGYEEQRCLLEMEGVIFNERNQIDLKLFLWNPGAVWPSR